MGSSIANTSKRALAEALLGLMEHEPFAKITVSQIAGKAGVARLTFYRHFETKENILAWYLEGLFETYTLERKERPVPDLEDDLALCFIYWERNAKTLQALSRNGLEHLLAGPFDDYARTILNAHGIESLSSLQIGFLAGGLSRAMLQWIDEDGPNITPHEAARDILSMIDLPGRMD